MVISQVLPSNVYPHIPPEPLSILDPRRILSLSHTSPQPRRTLDGDQGCLSVTPFGNKHWAKCYRGCEMRLYQKRAHQNRCI